MIDKLKPCPFCGKKDTLHIANFRELEECENFEGYNVTPYVAVVCDFNKGGCGASSGYRISSQKAVEVWNQRNTEVEE